jgi:hypothetical protein
MRAHTTDSTSLLCKMFGAVNAYDRELVVRRVIEGRGGQPLISRDHVTRRPARGRDLRTGLWPANRCVPLQPLVSEPRNAD